MRRRGIALFLRSLDNDYQQRLRDDALTAGKRFGFTVTVLAAQNDAARQTSQIQAAVDKADAGDLAAVLVSPVRDEALEGVARATAAAGAGWVVLNREGGYVETLRAEFDGMPIFGVTPDQTGIGHIQAQQLRVLLPRGGRIVCLTGPARTFSAQRRLDGMREALDPDYGLTVLESDWTTEGARLLLDGWLGGVDARELPDAVCAQNDEMALGARQALRDASTRLARPDLAAVPITGCDGSPGLGQRLVREKRLWATVALPSAAGPAVDWLARWRDGGEAPPSHVTLPVSSFPELSKIKPAAA